MKVPAPDNRYLADHAALLLASYRGVEVMFRAFDILGSGRTDIDLLLTGRREGGLCLPKTLRHLGYPPDHLIPLFLNSLDVLVIVNRLSDFGNFSYPVKLYEAISCRTPVVATETGPTRWILGNREGLLAKPEDPADLAAKVEALLSGTNRLRSREHMGTLLPTL